MLNAIFGKHNFFQEPKVALAKELVYYLQQHVSFLYSKINATQNKTSLNLRFCFIKWAHCRSLLEKLWPLAPWKKFEYHICVANWIIVLVSEPICYHTDYTDAQWCLFSLKSRFFGLGQTNWADKFWGISCIFGPNYILVQWVLCPCFPLFIHYFYKKLSSYYLYYLCIWDWDFNFGRKGLGI